MFRRLRIAVLLYILLFVALGQFLAARRSTDWKEPLWADVYLVNADGGAETARYLDSLAPDAFAGVDRFLAAEAGRYGVSLAEPFRVRIAGRLDEAPPAVPDDGWFAVAAWSLRMRWFVTRLHWSSDGPTPDITLFALYEQGNGGALDRSTALQKGMIAVARLFADRRMHGSNEMIVAHEMLHTLGASDKYDLASGLPIHPQGYAAPDARPRFPQAQAELMAGRIPLAPDAAVVPESLKQVVVGPETALEIGWIDELPATHARAD